jgi:hypothetical protein
MEESNRKPMNNWGQDIRDRFPDWGTDAALQNWPEIRAKLSIGQAVQGNVIARAPFGVWIDIGIDVPALLLVPEIAGARERRLTFDEYPAIGVGLDATIIWLGDRGEIRLTQNWMASPQLC